MWNEVLKTNIPANWKLGVLSDIAEITMGQSPSGNSLNETIGTVFYQGSSDFGAMYPEERVYTSAPNRMAQSGDTLISVRAPVGAINVAYEDCCIGRGLAAIRGKSENTHFIRYLLKSNACFFSRANGAGTTFGSITKDDLFSMPVIIPQSATILSFERIAQKQESLMHTIAAEIRQLTQLRDWLLPMLMNGQATISD